MAAERHRAAALDGRHRLQLVEADVPGFGAAPGRPVQLLKAYRTEGLTSLSARRRQRSPRR
jgi:hypothetical protein